MEIVDILGVSHPSEKTTRLGRGDFRRFSNQMLDFYLIFQEEMMVQENPIELKETMA